MVNVMNVEEVNRALLSGALDLSGLPQHIS
jgi:hypothetical protein